MALDFDEVLGVIYMDVADFQDRAEMFGVRDGMIPDDSMAAAYLAAASRYIEARTSKTYIPDYDYIEQHKWDAVTRRITVNNPPILSVSDYRIYTGASSYASFPVSALYINNQENWVELTSLTAAGNLTSMLLTLGLFEPIVQITYKSQTSVKENIKLACGYVAGALVQQSFLQRVMPGGINTIQVGEVRASRGTAIPKPGAFDPPAIVDLLLLNEGAIGIA